MPSGANIRILGSELDFPLSIESIFGREGPLVLEIGFGNGAFLAEIAAAKPESSFLGVEIAAASLTRAFHRMRRNGLSNVRLFCGSALFVLRELLERHSVDEVYVNFPDPWPKERHHARRLLQAPFFELLSTRLKDGAALHLTSDHHEYFEFALEEARRTGLFRPLRQAPPPSMLRTKYALRWQAERKQIHHASIVKCVESTDPHPPTLERVPMAHLLLRGELSPIDSFEKVIRPLPDGCVVLRDLTRSLDGKRLRFEAFVQEGELRQDVVVEVRPSGHGIYVELSRFGSPVQSKGVRSAVEAVGDWLQSRGLQLVESGL